MKTILIVGAGIGGLASALALAQQGWCVQLIERASELSEAGAGIQLGPNAMKVIAALSHGACAKLHTHVLGCACTPEAIAIRNAKSGQSIQRIVLGEAALQKYGQVYASIHRADLQAALLEAVRQQPNITLHLGHEFERYERHAEHITLHTSEGVAHEGQALIGADGLWSRVRQQLLSDGPPCATGHAAFRTLVPRDQVPPALRHNEVGVWWGRNVHVVHYPVRSGSHWNIAVLAEVHNASHIGWSLQATHAQVSQAVGPVTSELHEMLQVGQSTGWRRWNLFDREPVKQIAQGAVALLGDAAHPMRPYLGQGAAMSLEAAWQIAGHLAPSLTVRGLIPQQMQHYSALRAQRSARVVRAARRAGTIFHMSGLAAKARDAVLALQGTKTLGLDWLYRH